MTFFICHYTDFGNGECRPRIGLFRIGSLDVNKSQGHVKEILRQEMLFFEPWCLFFSRKKNLFTLLERYVRNLLTSKFINCCIFPLRFREQWFTDQEKEDMQS